MSYFYGTIANYEGLFEMDHDGVVRPCDDLKQKYVDTRIAAGCTVSVLEPCKTGLHPLYDCMGREHVVLHKHYDRTFFHDISDDTVWCLLRDEKRVFHYIEDECPLTSFLQLAMERDAMFTLWNNLTEKYEVVKKAEHGWTVFTPSAVPGHPADEMCVPGIDCNRYALTQPDINGAS